MSASLTRGTTFTIGGTLNSSGLHTLVESMTISGIDRSNVDRTTVTPFTLSAAAPASPVDGEVWQNATTFIPVVWNATLGRWVPFLANCISVQMDSGVSAASAGNLLVGSSAGRFKVADGGLNGAVAGVAAIPIAADGWGVMVVHGICKASITGLVNAGEAVVLSATAGVAQSAGAAGSGYGPGAFAKVIVSQNGGAAWVNLKR